MPRAGLTRDAVADLAVEIVDRDGFASLTLAAVAGRAGVAVPSLYKHVASLADLRSAVAAVAVAEFLRRMATATVGRSHEEALRALGHAIRAYAREHPGLYVATQFTGHEDAALGLAQSDAVTLIGAVLRGFGLSDESTIDAVRATRSTIHGFVDLELNGGFGMPDDVDQSFEALLDMLVAGVSAISRKS